jgi:hypothetical protein
MSFARRRLTRDPWLSVWSVCELVYSPDGARAGGWGEGAGGRGGEGVGRGGTLEVELPEGDEWGEAREVL